MRNSICFAFAVIVLLTWSNTWAQIPPSDKDERRNQNVAFSKVVKDEGWELTDDAGSRQRDQEEIKIGEFPVTVKRFSPLRWKDTDYQIFSQGEKESLRISERKVRILGYSKFEANGKVFGYVVAFGLLNVRSDGSVALKGAMISEAYQDDDGDGTFETRISNKSSFDTVPEWVRALTPKRTKAASNWKGDRFESESTSRRGCVNL